MKRLLMGPKLSFWEASLFMLYLLICFVVVGLFVKPFYDSILGGILISALIFLTPVIFYVKFHRIRLDVLMPLSDNFSMFWQTLGCSIGFFLLSLGISNLSKWLLESEASIMTFAVSEDFATRIIPAVIVVPIIEEIFFRGLLLRGLNFRYGFLKSIIFISLFFAIIHLSALYNPVRFLVFFLTSALYSFVTLKSNNIAPSIICHSAFNLMYFVIPITMNQIHFQLDEPTLIIRTSIVFVCVGTGLVLWTGKKIVPVAKKMIEHGD
jgi:membrane protease YdiL (CAAX protease family)